MREPELKALDSSIHDTNEWLKELMEELSWPDRQQAYRTLRGVLHALRDRLPLDAVTTLGSQLPLLLRGVYYEDWLAAPQRQHPNEQSLDGLAEGLRDAGFSAPAPHQIAQAVLRLLARHVTFWPYSLVVLSGRAAPRPTSRSAG